jgi:NAD(P)-dependent dehydrogenase (short-subunit alcohol dehydrogenase family)
MSLKGRTILVTGAASGIGLATARAAGEAGAARLILVDRDEAALKAATSGLAANLLVGDVADEHFWQQAAPALAGLDHAVVNAGVAGAGAIATLAFAEWRRILSVNLDGAFLTMQAAMRAMTQRDTTERETGGGGDRDDRSAAYAASKAGLIQLVRVAAKEGAPRRIRVNAIAPAGVETPVWDAVPMFADRAAAIGRDAAFAELAALATPLGRYARPEEVAAQIMFLLSDDAALMTGSVLVSDGGYTL